MCGIDGSLRVVGHGNGGGGRPYRVFPYYKKSLVTQLSNIVIKLENLHT
jgi:hypothetical protein